MYIRNKSISNIYAMLSELEVFRNHSLCVFYSGRKFWLLMVQPRLALMSPMVYFLNAHGSGSLTRMVSTCMLLYTCHLCNCNFCDPYCHLIWFSEGSEKAFAYFWITDSCPLTVKAVANKAPFEVLSLAGSIADALQIWTHALKNTVRQFAILITSLFCRQVLI